MKVIAVLYYQNIHKNINKKINTTKETKPFFFKFHQLFFLHVVVCYRYLIFCQIFTIITLQSALLLLLDSDDDDDFVCKILIL